jgi:hypothetical protein
MDTTLLANDCPRITRIFANLLPVMEQVANEEL